MKTKFLDIILAIALLAVVVSGFSYTWTPSHAGTGMSADGRIICSVPSTSTLMISRDWGQTWALATKAPPGGSVSGSLVAFSADGSQIIACLSSNGVNGFVCRSTDFGTNWTKLSLPVLSGFASYCVACSANGSNVIAGSRAGPLYFSTNSGLNWSTSSVPATGWWSLASSASGERMVAAGNGLYFSTNFGASWTSNNLPAGAVCLSADGQSIGVANTNSCYISRDGGATWMTNGFSGGIACSANGASWIISGSPAPPYGHSNTTNVYTSSDGAVTWFTNSIPGGGAAAMSADGCEVVANGSLGRITPSPQLNIQPQDTNVALSWLLPSTNFVLQQSSDLGSTNWQPVSSAPTLNFTNLQQEVALPAPASNAFFRLIAQ